MFRSKREEKTYKKQNRIRNRIFPDSEIIHKCERNEGAKKKNNMKITLFHQKGIVYLTGLDSFPFRVRLLLLSEFE